MGVHPRFRLLPSLMVFGVLCAPATALAGSKKAPPPPPAAAETPPEPTPEERALVFAEFEQNIQAGQKARAADAILSVLADPTREMWQAEAYARLGKTLQELDLPYGALVAYSRSLSKDLAVSGASGIGTALQLADQVGDPGILEPVFATNVGGDVDRLVRSRMAYLAARENYRKGNYALALSLIKLVVAESPVFPDAQMLEGVILNQQGQAGKALPPLLSAQAAATKSAREVRFLDALNMDLARSYYGAQNYPRAIEYYSKIGRQSDFWLDAQFERAWAHFRIEDMNGVLGLLHNHNSPFFESWYYPEAELLRIYALFLLCKFPEASRSIDSFKAHYAPIHKELQVKVPTLTAESSFELVRTWKETGRSEVPVMVLRTYADEARFAAALDAVDHAGDEIKRLQAISANPFAAQVSEWVAARRAEIIRTEGERIRNRLQATVEKLGEMLTDAEMSKLDMLQMESRLYEMASQRKDVLEIERRVSRTERLRKGYVWWPWEGEYWQDEVGYYRVSAIPECPVGLRAQTEEKQ